MEKTYGANVTKCSQLVLAAGSHANRGTVINHHFFRGD